MFHLGVRAGVRGPIQRWRWSFPVSQTGGPTTPAVHETGQGDESRTRAM